LNVSADVGGQVEDIAVDVGDAVEKEDLLLRIIPSQ
jgi:multidrug efflux pump subunit AcrA (membrane-fusion protein)